MKKEGENILLRSNSDLKEESEVRVIKRRKNINIFLNLSIFLMFILLINISFISASQKYTLKVTEKHLFFVVRDNIVNENLINVVQVEDSGASESGNKDKNNINGIWKTASELKIGDELLTADGKKAKVISVKEINSQVEVYNLEALPFNDFVVREGVVVHNSNKFGLLDSIDENFMKLPRQEKLKKFKEITKRNFDVNSPEYQTIEEAHGREDLKINPDDIFAVRVEKLLGKKDVLEKAGFTEEEIKFLLKSGICGPEYPTPMDDYFNEMGDMAEHAAINIQNYYRLKEVFKDNKFAGPFGFKPRVVSEIVPTYSSVAERSSGDLNTRAWPLDKNVFYGINDFSFFDPRSTGNVYKPLEGWFYVLILKDGQAWIHPCKDVVLKKYPWIIVENKKGLNRRLDCVDSFVKVWMFDGKVIREPDGNWPIENPGLPTWKFENFRDAFIIRLDSMLNLQKL